mgnify:CR=1 FL=1
MRTGILFILTLILLTPIKANTNEISTSELGVNIKRSYGNSISFVERGVEFHVFLNGDFDFNVIIRSFLYNSSESYLSAMVGGAITAKSNPEQEHEETLVKIAPLLKAIRS